MYNVFANSGDELYGVEPVSYYIKNLLLTTVSFFPLFLISLPCLLLHTYMGDNALKIFTSIDATPRQGYKGYKGYNHNQPEGKDRNVCRSPFILLFVVVLSVVFWLALLFSRPHKVSEVVNCW